MIALLLVLGTFLYLTFIGQAVVALLRPRLGVLWSWFIAPTVGLALLIVLITRLNVWGIPVRVAGPWLTLGMFVAAVGIFIWRRPKLPWRSLGLICCFRATRNVHRALQREVRQKVRHPLRHPAGVLLH
jgi:hypothetical protein